MKDSSQSHDATLKALAVIPGRLSPGFNPRRSGYYAYVTHETASVDVTAEAAASGASLTINGAAATGGGASVLIDLNVGRNIVTIDVTAPDGTTKGANTLKVIRSRPTTSWVRAAEKCPWSPRDSCGELVFKDRMWLMGGYTPPLVGDVWSSGDGANWTEVGAVPCPSGIDIPLNWVYDDKMWVTSHEGKLFSSPDGADWSLVAEHGPWEGRYAAGGAAFAGRMWVMGGRSSDRLFNDVWSSTDGVHWDLETAEAPWSKRQLFSMPLVYDGKMWLIGGGISTYHPFRVYADVWNSPDGRSWSQVTDCAPWPPRVWSSAVVYRNRMWLLGGFRAEPTWNNFDDVWYSSDGVNWKRLISQTIWSPRHEVSAYVLNGKLWMVGGNAWPLMNDVWSLEIPGLTFLTQPPIEEFVTARYSYTARADFNESGRPVRYRLVDSPEWLSVDTQSGVVRGTPATVEDVTVTVEAYDDAGESARQSYTLHVLPVG